MVERVEADGARGEAGEVFVAFLKLGLTSFGGPIAHLGYFRDELVTRRRWLGEAAYADLVALCQFLPGPASSQVGFALGLLRAGPLGAAAAWLGFTLPSAVLMILAAYGAQTLAGPVGAALVHGLKLVAVAVVAQAVWGMARTLAPDRSRAAIALAALFLVALVPLALGQVAAIVLGALLGLVLCRGSGDQAGEPLPFAVSRRVGLVCLAVFAILLLFVPSLPFAGLFDAFYRSGALVFGGGHVVLPLLEAELVQSGWVSPDAFLAGYGVVQAMPGPLFTFAAYLGMVLGGVPGAALALVAIFLPGFLLLVGALPFWSELRRYPMAQAALRGTNAAVVGLLAAALYSPVWTSAVLDPLDFAIVAAGFLALIVWRVPPWLAVVGITALGTGAALWA